MRRTPIRRRNPERARRAWVRAYDSEAFVRWTRMRPCAACHRSPCEVAHILKSRAAGGRPWHCIPLCAECHREQHTIGVVTFAKRHGLDIENLAHFHWKRWIALTPNGE